MIGRFGKPGRLGLMAALAVGIGLAGLTARPAAAANGQVTVTATNTAKFTMTLDASSVAFGGSLNPAGENPGPNATSFVDGTSGAYYATNSAAGTGALKVTIQSNKAWGGDVAAAENSASSPSPDLTVAGGALRWKLGDIGALADATGATTFSTSADSTAWNAASSCDNGATKAAGVCYYKFDYALRIRWTDAPGGFTSVVTYTASQT